MASSSSGGSEVPHVASSSSGGSEPPLTNTIIGVAASGSQPPLAIGVAASSSRGSEPPMAIGVTAPSTAGEIWPEWRKGVHVAWVVSFPIKAARISSTAADQFDLAEKILALCRSNAGLDKGALKTLCKSERKSLAAAGQNPPPQPIDFVEPVVEQQEAVE
ncbi:unnamed protein product, partial [Polarella glacialis]